MGPDRRGEVWLVDLGYAAKTRPALVLSVPSLDTERALVLLCFVSKRAQAISRTALAAGLAAKPRASALRLMVLGQSLVPHTTRLSESNFDEVLKAVNSWLGLSVPP